MKTTMADSASERLDAQIADALFGQPGMSKLHVANRLRELRGDGAALLVHPDDKAAGAAKGALLALGYQWNGFRWERSESAAQPSPAGQVQPLPPIREDQPLRGNEPIGEQHDARMFNRGWNACREAAAALAARQPVGQEPVVWVSPEQLEAHADPLRGEGGHYLPTRKTTAGKFTKPLFDAPPAQAVDLAQEAMFYVQDTRQFVGNCPVWWSPNGSGYVTRLDEAGRYTEQEAVKQNRCRQTDIPWPCAEIEAIARRTVDFQHMRPRAERLAELALIDSQVVGNG